MNNTCPHHEKRRRCINQRTGLKPAWWHMGSVEETIPDKEGTVRQVNVRRFESEGTTNGCVELSQSA
jgi:hypothetical protein